MKVVEKFRHYLSGQKQVRSKSSVLLNSGFADCRKRYFYLFEILLVRSQTHSMTYKSNWKGDDLIPPSLMKSIL